MPFNFLLLPHSHIHVSSRLSFPLRDWHVILVFYVTTHFHIIACVCVGPFGGGSAECPLPAVNVDCNSSLVAAAVDVGLLYFSALD